MSQLQITNAGIDYRNAVFAGDEVQNITHFVFANKQGQDASAPIDPNTTIPANVLHTQPVKAVSKVDGNAIVMSAVLGYDIGDFEYNWYGVIATKANNEQVLIAVVTTETQTKTKTVGAVTGNYSVKSIVWRSQNIADDLNITLSVLPWQVQDEELVSRADFDAALNGKLDKTATAANSLKLGGQSASYYAKASDVKTPVPAGAVFTDTNTWRAVLDNLTSTATDKSLSANQGRVLKGLIDNINTILMSDDSTLDEMQEVVDYIKQNKSTLESLSISNIAGLQNALNGKVSNSRVLTDVPAGAVFTDTRYILSNSVTTDSNEYVATSRAVFKAYARGTEGVEAANAVQSTLNQRLPKPAVKHYYIAGNVTINFGDAQRHIVTRWGAANGTITLTGTLTAGDELIVNNVRDDSGVATITGKTMFTGQGSAAETSHTLTGQAKLNMTAYSSSGLMVTEVV